jgi:hypothetical protein
VLVHLPPGGLSRESWRRLIAVLRERGHPVTEAPLEVVDGQG